MQQVETGLLPGLQLVGEPPVRYGLAERMRVYNVPAVSIAVINNGKLEWAKAYGYLSRDSLQPANTETLFQAASISKPVAAMGALKLVEQGTLSLDADVNGYLKSWKIKPSRFNQKQPVTLRGLLSHTAGLTVHGFGGYTKGKDVPTLVQVLNGEKPANSPAVVSDTVPGVRFRYSGGGYVVMQQAVEDVMGEPFAAFMQQTVLTPLKMTRSTYEQPLPASLTVNAAVGHFGNGRKIPGNWNTYPEQAPAGLWTTPSDLARYILDVQQSLTGRGKPLLTAATTKAMLTPQVGGHGLGPELEGKNEVLAFSHGGSNAGYKCQFYAYAGRGQGVVIMTNADRGLELIAELMRSMSAAYDWPGFKPTVKKLAQVSPQQLDKLAGHYTIKEQPNLILEISAATNELRVKELWSRREYTLQPESATAFFMKENGAPFVFNCATDGTVTGLLAFEQDHWVRMK